MPLPQEILQRVQRVAEYHELTKLPSRQDVPPDAPKPNPDRVLADLPRFALPTDVMGASTPTIALLRGGLDAVPPSQLQPPQNLRTLAAWLYLGAGNLSSRIGGRASSTIRAYPSEESLYPCEVYFASFAVEGIEAGLYHFCSSQFALYKLREGAETLAQIKRGRPELEFLKTTPGVLIVSSIFCRSSWRYGLRGYRHALCESGRLIQNLSTAGVGLGIQTLVRLTANARNMSDLIGVPFDAPYGQAEAVQGLVIWADPASKPMPRQTGRTATTMPPIERPPLAETVIAYDMIPAIHTDCVAPGVALREVRPPLTELSPLPDTFPIEPFPDMETVHPFDPGKPLDELLLAPEMRVRFAGGNLSRDRLWSIARAAFRWGTSYPLFPDGPHVALIRPLWIMHQVTGFEPGAWYYHPEKDGWSPLRMGAFRREGQILAMSDPRFGDALAVCFMIANLRALMTEGGPDLYRLAHLEAGTATRRLNLASRAVDLTVHTTSQFFDDEIRRFFGLDKTVWHPLYALAIGNPVRETK